MTGSTHDSCSYLEHPKPDPPSTVDRVSGHYGTEIGRPFSRTIEDQQLMLDEHRFGHDGTGAARTGEPGDCRN